VSLRLGDRWLDWTLRIVGVLVIGALLYLGYTVWQGERQVRQGSLSSRAIENLKEMVRSNPENAEARVLLGDAYRDVGGYNDAIEQYNAALDLKKDHIGALSGLGLTAMATDEWMTASGYWETVIEALRDEPSATSNLALEKAYYYYGVTLIELAEYEDAVNYLKEALRIRRDDADTHYALSVAYGKLDSAANQEASLRNALAFVPSMPEANYDLALILLAKGDEAGAAELFRRSVDGAPYKTEPAEELAKLGPFETRWAKVQELLATDPAGALVEARIAIALDPKNVDAARTVARLLQQLGNTEDARTAWARVLELVADDPEALEQIDVLDAAAK
jgi:Flp pilus assembly protein TadD